LAKLFGEEPVQQMRDDVRRFKQVMETGEVTRSDASPEEIDTARLLRQRAAQPRPLTRTQNGSRRLKANCWTGKNTVEVEEVPDPKILSERDAIVRITTSAIADQTCTSTTVSCRR
jgi:hypothetical protein